MSLLTKTAQALLMSIAMWMAVPEAHAEGSKTYTFTIERTMDQEEPTACQVHETVLKANLNMETLDFSKLHVYSVQASGVLYTSWKVQPLGNYFGSTGNVVTSKLRAIGYITFDTQKKTFYVMHMSGNNNAQDGQTYTMRECIINSATNDTVFYNFNMTMGTKQSVSSDEPAFVHRADKMDSWPVLPYVQVNDQAGDKNFCVQASVGDNITFGVRPRNEGEVVAMQLTAPDGTRLVRMFSQDDYTLSSVEKADAGIYTCRTRMVVNGKSSFGEIKFMVDVQEHQGEYFDWDADGPYWSYDFRDEYEAIPAPTKIHSFTQKNGKAANEVHGDWWSIFWGDNLNPKCGDATVAKKTMENAIQKYETDFAYIRDEMGWPPDINARQGWKSFVYVLGSGLSQDSYGQNEEGGWQGTEYADGRSWPCVTATWAPMARFRDDASSIYSDVAYQTDAMIHEGIHAIFADYPGCKSSAWFQEAGNVWLQGAMNAKRGLGAQVSGWLGVGNLICPFMPIECYSGWLQDGSFGGPAAEGVNMYGPNGQVCTWRNLIGGVQYGETFPIFLGLNVGQGSVPWIWRYCTDYVLKGIAQGKPSEGVEGIGDEGMRQLIMHYRAKLATMDFKESSNGMRQLLDNSFGVSVRAEYHNGVYDPATGVVTGRNSGSDQMACWIDCAPFKLTPYQTVVPNDADGWMAPDPLTNPGWSGGNIIPIHVGKNGCEIEFRPEDDNMRCQLCFRTRDGRTFYSQPVVCGKMVLNWDDSNQPANGIVFVVPCNTDYIFTGDAQRKKHWDYRIRLGRGAYAPADIYQKWYFYERTITDPTYDETIYTGVEEIAPAAKETTDEGNFRILTSILKGGQKVQLDLGGVPANEVKAHLVGLAGVVIDEQTVADDGTVQMPAHLNRGMYVLALNHNGKIQSFKVFAE
ncbi:MAG: hypothetical protein II801_00660 [Bacteroidaceae bacterium]|nr:hypothetical protein [Bacteroidaceae bacterium]